MNEQLSRLYFHRALCLARENRLTAAQEEAARAVGLDETNSEAAALLELLSQKLGNLTCPLAEYGSRAGSLSRQSYAALAASYENRRAELSLREQNLLGCLYAVLGRTEKASAAFLAVLGEDSTNGDALRYTIALEQPTGWRRWIQRLRRN